jgi:hypothetical protein
MDCVPGNVDHVNGEPITILTLAHNDEIEQPMAVTIPDTKRLVVQCLISLAVHGDDKADHILDHHFSDGDGDDDDPAQPWQPHPAPPKRRRTRRPPPHGPFQSPDGSTPPPLPMRRSRLTPRKASRVKFTVQWGQSYRPRNRLFVIGAYKGGDDLYILYRLQPSKDGIALIVPPKQIVLRDDDDLNRIPDQKWADVLSIRDGYTFSHNGRAWTRLSPKAVAPFVEGKVFRRRLPGKS